MSYSAPGGEELTNNERREAARAKAKALRDQHRKKERRSRAIFRAVVLAVVLGLAATIAVIFLASANRPATAGPRNMLSDGILIGEGFVAKPTAALQPGQAPVPNDRDEASDVIAVQMYMDYFCDACAAFEEANNAQISTLVESGAATVEIFPYALYDSVSQGTKYSTRSANAAACVADQSPNAFYDFNHRLLAKTPEQGSGGLTDEQLLDLAVKAGVTVPTAIEKCITDQTFKTWVTEARDRHREGPIPNTDLELIEGAPTIIVNGVKYTGALNDSGAFGAFMLQAANTSFNEKATPTPTPTPTPEPTKKK